MKTQIRNETKFREKSSFVRRIARRKTKSRTIFSAENRLRWSRINFSFRTDLRNSRPCNADVCYPYARSHRGACGNSQSVNQRIASRDRVQKFSDAARINKRKLAGDRGIAKRAKDAASKLRLVNCGRFIYKIRFTISFNNHAYINIYTVYEA